MVTEPEPKRVVGVVIFMAIFIGAALILQGWEAYQGEGWSGLYPMVWAVVFGSLAGFAVEMLDVSLGRHGRIASTVFRVVLGLTGLLLAIAGIGLVWSESDAGFLFSSPILAGVGLTRLVVWMWRRRSRDQASAIPEPEEAWR